MRLLTILLLMITSLTYGQDVIKPRKGKAIRDIIIHEIKETHVVFEHDQALHDYPGTKILYVIQNGKTYLYDTDGLLVDEDVAELKQHLDKKLGSKFDHQIALYARPLGLVDRFNTLHGGINMKIADDVFLKSGIGIIYGSWGAITTGAELKTSLKYAVTERIQKNGDISNTYVGVELGYYYKDQPGSFRSRRIYSQLETNFIIGSQFQKSFLFIDLYTGLGVRTNTFRDYNYDFPIHFLAGVDIGINLNKIKF